jgi:hypothetical protein
MLDQLHPQGIAFAERFASARPRPDNADGDQLAETLDGRSGACREFLLCQPHRPLITFPTHVSDRSEASGAPAQLQAIHLPGMGEFLGMPSDAELPLYDPRPDVSPSLQVADCPECRGVRTVICLARTNGLPLVLRPRIVRESEQPMRAAMLCPVDREPALACASRCGLGD